MPKTKDDSDDFFDTSPEKMSNAKLKLYIERWERLDEEKRGIADDQKDVMTEIKSDGYDTKIVRHMIKLRKMETHTRQEWDALVEAYREELGLV